MGTLATIIAGIVLAGAATAGVVATQADAPAGGGLPTGGTVVSYEQGQ
ncbi:MAG: hypothetical protein JWN17_1685 [Frankiales bacterium]|nr:hypothetical protein [Frankiales bacterium]